MTINHLIKPECDLNLAMIEGTPVEGLCGVTFTPSVQMGTSGRADVPTAPICDHCETAKDISEKWSRLADERELIQHEMDALNAEHRVLRRMWRKERETAREVVVQP